MFYVCHMFTLCNVPYSIFATFLIIVLFNVWKCWSKLHHRFVLLYAFFQSFDIFNVTYMIMVMKEAT